LFNAPEGYLEEIDPLHDGVVISDKLDGPFDWVEVFVQNKAELSAVAPHLLAALKPLSLLWITFPKGSSKAQADLTRDKGWEAMRGMPLMWINLVSVNAAWSAFSMHPLRPGETSNGDKFGRLVYDHFQIFRRKQQ